MSKLFKQSSKSSLLSSNNQGIYDSKKFHQSSNRKSFNYGNSQSIHSHHRRNQSNQILQSSRIQEHKNILSEITNYNVNDDPGTLNQNSQYNTDRLITKPSFHNQSKHAQSTALQSFYLSQNVKVFIGINDQVNDDSILNSGAVALNDQDKTIVDLNFNQELYKQYQFTKGIKLFQENLFDLILIDNILEENQSNQITTIMTYGRKSMGKSQLLGTLFENDFYDFTLIKQTLQALFSQCEESFSEIYISCYEVFLETLTDLFDETNEGFTTENDITWLRVSTFEQAEQQFKIAFLNRKQIVDENGLSFSQSHLIVNIKICDSTSEGLGKIISFVDLVGFDQTFTQKIMEGSSFSVNDISDLQKGDDQISDFKLQQIISECNDNNLYSLRNLLIAIESEQDDKIQQVIDETTLARVIFAKLLQSNNFYVIGTVSDNQNNFNESLNTLEFCTKVQNALTQQQQQPIIQNQSFKSQESTNNLYQCTEEGGKGYGLPQELSAYLDCNYKKDQMSRFYNNNSTIVQNGINITNQTLRERLKTKSTILQNNRSNISMNSTRMHWYLDKFLHKQQYGDSNIISNDNSQCFTLLKSRNLLQQKENAIKIQQDFKLDSSSQFMKSQANLAQRVKNSQSNKKTVMMIKPPSEKSTGFATNTQLTHMRKYSQDMITNSHNNINQMSSSNINRNINLLQKPRFENTYSELNFNPNETKPHENQKVFNLQLGNFSKIQDNKSKYDSSFLSNFIMHGETPQNQACQQALAQFKHAKEIVASTNITQQRSKSQINGQQSISTSRALPPKYSKPKTNNEFQNSTDNKPQPLAQVFINSVIKESLKSFDVQMKDFYNFFLKENPKIEGCFACSNQSQPLPPSNFSDIFKKQKARFFDIDKVLKEVEQREIRHQTLNSIRESNASCQKNQIQKCNQS